MEIAYISVNSLSFVSCSLLGVLGFVSPVYKSYPTKIQVWIAWNLIFQSIAGYFDIGKSNSSNLELGLATYLCAEAFYGLMIIFLYELWATLTSPFLSTKSKGFFYSLVICVIFGGWATTIYYREQFYDSPTLGSSLLENMFSKALALWLFFALRIYILLKETQNQQDQEVYNFKSQYFKRQMIWFLFLCVIELIAALIKEKQVALLMLYCIGFQFAFFQLLHKFPLLKLKVLFFQSCCTPEQINTIVQIENGTYSSDDYILTVDALKNAQIVELVKAILLSVNECLQLQFLYNSGLNPIKRVFKFELDLYSMKSSKLGQNNQTRVLLKTYYPDGFKDLMRRDGYDKEVIGETLNLENNLQAFKKTKESMGKSGAFFFFSQNSKLILKTLTKQELKSFLHRIEYYFIHLGNYPQSSLAKIYGLYKVKLVSFYDTYLVLMENSFEQLNQLGGPQRVYDLKGSITNRTSKTTEFVKKDNNFLKSLDMPIKLFDSNPLLTQIEMDSNFLLSIGYMDYSLLIGIRNRSDEQINETLPRLLSGDNCVYSFSIIDYLQEFDCNKKMEFSYKSLKGKRTELSCIEPIAYNARFKQFCKAIIVELDQQ